MAKRFGRNQRKRLREEVYRAQYIAAMAERDLANERTRRNHLESLIEEWDKRIRRELGHYSALLSEPARVAVQHFFNRVPTYRPLMAFMARDPAMTVESTMDYITLSLLRVLSQEDVLLLRQNIQIIQVAPSGEQALAFHSVDQREVWRSDPEALARFMARQIVHFLTKGPHARAR
jgi:hypothetical protein